jgi:hypothetical protein
MFSDVKKRDLMENKGSYGKQMYFMWKELIASNHHWK